MAKRMRLYQTNYIGDIVMADNKQYGCLNFLFDILMVCITGGLWLIRTRVREMRK